MHLYNVDVIGVLSNCFCRKQYLFHDAFPELCVSILSLCFQNSEGNMFFPAHAFPSPLNVCSQAPGLNVRFPRKLALRPLVDLYVRVQ